jgi:predicted HTH transcriptional regulator
LEFKGPGARTDKGFLAVVVRAVLGMADHRDGGFVVIGVRDNGGELEAVGVNEEERASWQKCDDVSEAINAYADPTVTLAIEEHTSGGKNFVLIVVSEFADVPVLCAKDQAERLRRGACYVRSRHKRETAEISTQEEMRDLLDLAIEKGLRRFLTRAQNAGVFKYDSASSATDDAEKFRKEAGEW